MPSISFLGNTRVAVIFLSLFLTIFFVNLRPSHAGDLASVDIIGFSPDGNYFAFEEYGRQDGSGFPYATIYVINTRKNTWVKGSPYRILIKKERAQIKVARNAARSKFRALRRRLRIFRKGRHLASNPATELSANPHRVEVSLNSPLMVSNPDAGNPLIFSLREIDLPVERCRKFTNKPIKGFVWRVRRPGEPAKILHRDKRIPKSRGCPFNYAISDVAALRKPDGSVVYTVISSVFRQGFEGPERRFVAGGYHHETRRAPVYYGGSTDERDFLDAETYRDPDAYRPGGKNDDLFDVEPRQRGTGDPFDRSSLP